ncbi:hypothetical protein [Bradyrhizobium sp. Ec3.3]|uniref:type IV toxin-antitoxin system AbiEi family antitoxin domain-containing protein n=1 Tax=Bradyrhizobium sp. Ec3.3 TaxID=189753 RepID=UPI0004848A7A|nr:hypothetical protein [Bradyrhizobium sp. Ec3.3]
MLSEERTLVHGAGGEPIRAEAERLAEARGPPLEELKRHLSRGTPIDGRIWPVGRDLSTSTLRESVESCTLRKLSGGIYAYPRETALGGTPASDEDVLEAFLKAREWRPRIERPGIEIIRFGPNVFDKGIEHHTIENVPVRIYSPAKTIVDLFRSVRFQHAAYEGSCRRHRP